MDRARDVFWLSLWVIGILFVALLILTSAFGGDTPNRCAGTSLTDYDCQEYVEEPLRD